MRSKSRAIEREVGLEKAYAHLPRRPRLVDQPLSLQFSVAAAMVAVFLIGSTAVLFDQVRRQGEASRFLNETRKTIDLLSTLATDANRQRGEVQEYLRSREEIHLANARERRQLWESGIQELATLVSDNPAQVQTLQNVIEANQSWVSLTEAKMFELGSQLFAQPNKAIDPIYFREENTRFRRTILLLDKMVDREKKLLAVRDDGAKEAIQKTATAIAILNLAVLLVFGFVLVRLYIGIARPLEGLSRAIYKYLRGDFSTRVKVASRSQVGFLQATFNDMAEKIETLVADLRKLDELKTEFLSTVSHELRTPLTSIAGYVKLLVGGDAGQINETQREFLSIIDTNVVRLTRLINDILDVEKMESGKVQLVKEPQELGLVLKECYDTFAVVAREKGLALKLEVPNDALMVMGDKSRLVQVFMNLLSNAVKYTKEGSVTLAAERNGFAVRVRVSDTGVGLTAEEQEKLFQKFYRARSGLASTEGGTGLGLVIVRGLVEAHGGSVVVESTAGRGTSFVVTLPLISNLIKMPERDGREVVRSQNLPVWVVCADATESERVAGWILEMGASVGGFKLKPVRFHNLDELPGEISADNGPCMILVDTGKTGGEGDVLSRLRARLHHPIPVLALSRDPDTEAAFNGGAIASLKMPLQRNKLVAAVADVANKKSWRILVADDNADLRLLIKRSLVRLGCEVDDVDRGNAVLGRLEKGKYDLILIDINFPDVSGVEILKIIRRNPAFAELPVFVMAEEYKDMPTTEQLEKLGANAFVAKYKGISHIVDTVHQHFEDTKFVEQLH